MDAEEMRRASRPRTIVETREECAAVLIESIDALRT